MAFATLLQPHLDHLYRIACRFTGSAADAEDLVQDLLIKLFRKTAELAQVEQLRPWLTRALYHQFIDNARRRASSALGRCIDLPCADDQDALDLLPASDNDPEDGAEQALTRERLHEAVGALSEPHRAVIVLHDVEGYGLDELATLLDLPTGTLKSRLHRARRRLRAHLTREPSVRPLRVNERGA